jgi:hypothetical protein
MAENSGMDLRPPSDVEQMTSAQAGQKLAELKVEFDRANSPAPAAPLSPGASALTPAQAAARLAQLQSDPKWVEKFLDGSGQEKREFAQLSEIAGDATPDAPFETVDAVSNPSALSRAAYSALMDGLRDQGLPDRAETFIRASDAGLTDYTPTQGDGIAFQRALDRYLKDPVKQKQYLDGSNIEVTATVNNLSRVVALASQVDGRPVTDEAVQFLTKLGLR